MRQRIKFINRDSKPLKVILEPWAEEEDIETQTSTAIVIRGDINSEPLEIVIFDRCIALHAPARTIADFEDDISRNAPD